MNCVYPSIDISYNMVFRSETMDNNVLIKQLSDKQLDEWYKLCVDSFAYKANPPSFEYFKSHFEDDIFKLSDEPTRDIFIACISSSNNILCSSARVFRRPHKSNSIIFGLGEVCTCILYQGLGISRCVLELLHSYIDGHNNAISILHANNRLAGFYSKFGYKTFTNSMKWTYIETPVACKNINTDFIIKDDSQLYEVINGPITSDLSVLLQDSNILEQMVSIQSRFLIENNNQFIGLFSRSQLYYKKWYLSDWLRNKYPQGSYEFSSIMVAPIIDISNNNNITSIPKNTILIGWMYGPIKSDISEKPLRCRDFAIDLKMLRSLFKNIDIVDETPHKWCLRLLLKNNSKLSIPSFVWNLLVRDENEYIYNLTKIKKYICRSITDMRIVTETYNNYDEIDDGWMIRGCKADEFIPFVWPVDSF